MTTKTFFIVYPEYRNVSEDIMRGWAEDAIANKEIPGPASLPLEDLAAQLNSEGLITLGGNPNFEGMSKRENAEIHFRNADPDCQCAICTMGIDAYTWNYSPSEY